MSDARAPLATLEAQLRAVQRGHAGGDPASAIKAEALADDVRDAMAILDADRLAAAERIESLVLRHMRESIAKAVSAYHREWDRVVNVFTDETRFVFGNEDEEDDAATNFKDTLGTIVKKYDFDADITECINKFATDCRTKSSVVSSKLTDYASAEMLAVFLKRARPFLLPRSRSPSPGGSTNALSPTKTPLPTESPSKDQLPSAAPTSTTSAAPTASPSAAMPTSSETSPSSASGIPPPLKPRPKVAKESSESSQVEVTPPTPIGEAPRLAERPSVRSATVTERHAKDISPSSSRSSVAQDLNKILAAGPKPLPRSGSNLKEQLDAVDFDNAEEYLLQGVDSQQQTAVKSEEPSHRASKNQAAQPSIAPQPTKKKLMVPERGSSTHDRDKSPDAATATAATTTTQKAAAAHPQSPSLAPAVAPRPRKSTSDQEKTKEEQPKRSLLSSLTKARPRRPGAKSDAPSSPVDDDSPRTDLSARSADPSEALSGDDGESKRSSIVNDGQGTLYDGHSQQSRSGATSAVSEQLGTQERHAPPAVRPRTRIGGSDRPNTMFESGGSPLPISIGDRPFSHHGVEEEFDPTPMHSQDVSEDSPAVKPRPKKSYGVFSTNHGALGALAAAVTGRSSFQPHVTQEPQQSTHAHESSDAESPAPVREKKMTHARTMSSDSSASSPQEAVSPTRSRAPTRMGYQQPDVFNSTPLQIKRKEASVSGDDKAIEKMALDWLNAHLASRDIQITDLYKSLDNGLNLLYALEDCTGENVGKYSKRVMLPVHKIDNISVALLFLNKHGINTSFVNPQDLMEGDKSKILTLFTFICRTFPLAKTPTTAEPNPTIEEE